MEYGSRERLWPSRSREREAMGLLTFLEKSDRAMWMICMLVHLLIGR